MLAMLDRAIIVTAGTVHPGNASIVHDARWRNPHHIRAPFAKRSSHLFGVSSGRSPHLYKREV
jgi:hypothetical protein